MLEYNFESILPEGRYKGKTVREVFDKNKSSIFKLIKRYGYSFSDDVLAEAHIRKISSEHHAYLEWEHHATDNKRLKKDTKTIEEILDEMDYERLKVKLPKDDKDVNKEKENKGKGHEEEDNEIE